jgi:hypothetical protein
MTIAQHTPRATYLRFEGRVGIWNGLTPPVAYSDFVNFEKIEITAPEQEKEKLISRMTSSFGSALDSQQKPTDSVAAVSLEFSTLTPKLIELVLGSTLSEVTQTTGAVADEAVTTVLNVWVPLANRSIAVHGTGTEIVLEVPDNTTIANTKYEIDHELGMIKAIHADAVGTGVISYHKAARTWENYAAGLASSGYVHISGQATDLVTNLIGTLDIWRANLAPSGAFDPVAGGHLKGALGGDLITPAVAIGGGVQTSPWRWRIRTA